MTLAVTAAPPTRSQPGVSRATVRTVLAVLVVAVLLVPAGYLFLRQWTATGTALTTTAAERAAVAYARPVDRLLAVLVDTQLAAVRGTAVDPATVRAAVDDVDTVDRGSANALLVHQRWTELSHEIDNALSRNTAGTDALKAYAAPIALAQALLDRIVAASKVTTDATTGSYQLAQVALRSLPEVVVDAGQVDALAVFAPDPRLSVAEDRLTRAAGDASTGLRSGSDQVATYAVDLNLLKPLDEFTAAADTMGQAAAALDTPASAPDRVDAARADLASRTLVLEAAVLDTFESRLSVRAAGYAGQRRLLVLSALAVVLAATALLWLALPRRVAVPRPRTAPAGGLSGGLSGGLPEAAEGRHSQPVATDRTGNLPDLVDARELLTPLPAQRTGGLTQEAAQPR